LTLNSGSSHNAFYIEKDITEWYQDGSLWNRIAGINGYDEFEGVFPGCYFDMSRKVKASASDGGSREGDERLIILGCNSLMYQGRLDSGDTQDLNHGIVYKIDFNHIVVCPRTIFGEAIYNPSDNDNTSYFQSHLNNDILGAVTTTGNIGGTINEQLYAEFDNHLKAFKKFHIQSLDKTIYNPRTGSNVVGKYTQRTLVQSILFSEVELYGHTSFSLYGRETSSDRGIFPAFIHNPSVAANNYYYYTRDTGTLTQCVNSDKACGVTLGAIGDKSGIRPYFVLA